MKTAAIIIGLSILISTGFHSEEKGLMRISLTNIKNTGKINIAVYSKGEDFLNDKSKAITQSGESANGKCEFQFELLPFGEYAIAIYQDVDGNGKLDTGLFGIPSEPFAFSNNYRPRFGKPDFDDCKFKFSKSDQVVEIEMINSLFGGD